MDKQEDSIFGKIPETNYTEETELVDPGAFRAVVEARRSVRVFTKEPIPEAVVNDCIDLALLAPNSSNLQPWEFYWARSPEKKAEVAEACFSQPAARTAQELIVCVARIDTWKRHRDQMLEAFRKEGNQVPRSAVQYYEKLVPMAYSMGPLGILGPIKKLAFWLKGLSSPMVREPTSIADLKLWASKSTALACENLMLAFRAHGYDTCPMEGMDSSRIKQIVGVPSSASVVMVIGAGKRSKNGVYGPRVRFDRSQFVKEL